ncbi:MAG: YezD family protein [candidate division NC10 bacterium]|nr:YezD family protein [candidate division NC10 bacterium]
MNGAPIPPRHAGRPENDEIVEQIVKAISSLRYGHVQIVIQDSRVVQIDRTEKVRLA